MRSVSLRLVDLQRCVIPIGYVGENEHTRVQIDAMKLIEEYPNATVSMTVQPPEGESYPAVVTRDGNIIIWDVTDSDLIAEGQGEIQVSFSVGDVVAKSFIGRIRIDRSIVPTGEIPEPIDDWLTRAGAALTELDNLSADAVTLDAGSQATAEITEVEGHKNIHIGVPKGADAPTDTYAPKANPVFTGSISMGRKSGTTVGSNSVATGSNVTASASNSHAEGIDTQATGWATHAEGAGTIAAGDYSHTEGANAKTTAAYAHAEGGSTTASGTYAHAEGSGTTASGGYGSHAEGSGTTASGNGAHAEGGGTTASGYYSHAEGQTTVASGILSHAEGEQTIANHKAQHVFGTFNTADNSGTGVDAKGNYVEIVGNGTADNARSNARTLDWNGNETLAGNIEIGGAVSRGRKANTTIGTGSLAVGYNVEASAANTQALGASTKASGACAHAEGSGTVASGGNAHAEGTNTTASNYQAHAEGGGTEASGSNAHAEGGGTHATGANAHSEGSSSTASGSNAHAEGGGTTASGDNSHAEGGGSQATASQAHAEGGGTHATAAQAHAEGAGTYATGAQSHAEGVGTTASGGQSHAEGSATIASGVNSHAEGGSTVANHEAQHVFGTFNVEDPSDAGAAYKGNYVEIVGNGTANNARSNARTLDWSGNEELAGDLTVFKGTQNEKNFSGLISDLSSLNGAIDGKQDAPETAGTAGQVLGLDSNLDPVWTDASIDPSDIAQAVDDWCDENITNPDSPPLDRSLTSSSAAAPADMVGDIKDAISDLDENLYNDTSVVAGGSKEFSDADTFTHGLGNIRYFSYTSESKYEINKIKIRAYANESAVCKFKLITVEFSGTSVYVRSVSNEFTLEDPTGTFEDYTITLDTPFVVPAGQMVGVCGSDSDNTNWLYYSEAGTDVSYYVRTQAYSDIVADFRLQTYLPTLLTGKLPITFYSGDKEFIHIYTEEEIEEIAEAASSELSDEIETVSGRVDELGKNKNTSSDSWQSGVWSDTSSASISTNSRYISYKTYLDEIDFIVNKDTTKYKYGIIAHDLNATNPGEGWYNPSTGSFAKYQKSYITVERFDLSCLKLKYPGYSFTISVCHVADTDVDVNEYKNVEFIKLTSYSKEYTDHVTPKIVYVATDGNDANDGHDSNHPVLTINHALELGATRILLAGGNYSEQIDIGRANGNKVSIEALEANNSPVIYAPGCTIAESETAVSDYTKVYSASTDHTFPSTTSKIFLDGVADTATEIDDADRHPLQRGNFYRCSDTMISRCTETTLSNALAEIESSNDYRWFYDSGTIYFSRPSSVSSSHPLMTGLYDNTLFISSAARDCSVEMSGLVIKYARVNLDGFSNAKMTDCKVFGACGGGIMYNNALSVTLERCDVSRAYSGTLGDGICATGSNSYGQAYGTTVTMIDCWAHDNNDDGFSDHVGCESTIIGGLYEHNGKGGVLPAGGGSCTCYNVESRYNAIGFEVAGSGASTPVASGRNGQQMTCFGCITKGNTQYGFFSAGNQDMTIKLVGCKAIGDDVGYFGPYNATDAEMIAIDCSASGCRVAKADPITVINTTLLS